MDIDTKKAAAVAAVTGEQPENIRRQMWCARARTIAAATYRKLKRPISTDDVAPMLPPIPEGADRRILTACFSKKDWKAVGTVKSRDPACNGRHKTLWVPA